MAKKTIKEDKAFQKLLEGFETYIQTQKVGSSDYIGYLNSIQTKIQTNNTSIITWLNDAKKQEDAIGTLLKHYNSYFESSTHNPSKSTINSWRTALKLFGKFVLGKVNAQANLASIKGFDWVACNLIAQSAIFCSQDIFKKVTNGQLGSDENQKMGGNAEGAWFHHTIRRKTDEDKKNMKMNLRRRGVQQ